MSIWPSTILTESNGAMPSSGLLLAQVGASDEDLMLTNDAGRIRLDADQVADLIKYLEADDTYSEWFYAG